MSSLRKITEKYIDRIAKNLSLIYKVPEANPEFRNMLEDELMEYVDQVLIARNELLDNLVRDYQKKFEKFMFE